MFVFYCILILTTLTAAQDSQETKTNVTNPANVVKVDPKVQVMEGGETPENSSTSTTQQRHYGREHVTDAPKHSIALSTTEKVIPISEKQSLEYPPDKSDHKKTVPKKGVSFPENLNTTNSTTTTTSTTSTTTTSTTTTSTTTTTPSTTTVKIEAPKKPLVTIGNGEEPYAPSHFVSSKGRSNKTSSIPKVPSLEAYESSKSKSSIDYVVPIIGVILSVPLVAVVMNIIYKRSKEWWHHRHYSRMDFLIEGMYN